MPTANKFEPVWNYADMKTALTNPDHDWSKPIEQGPGDIGFKTSYITSGGIQAPPYAFFRDDILDVSLDQVKYWENGNYSMPNGLSIINREGQGFEEWDSTSYNMILVNETKAFLDQHIDNAGDPFFAYVPIGNAHTPHSPPDTFLDGTNVAGSYGTRHMDILFEMDKVVGALIQALTDRQLLEDTIIIFTSDNGGLNGHETNSINFDHLSSGQLRGSKGQVYEGGIRVPLTIRWDNGSIPKGEKRSQMIGLNDLYKTICGLVGVDVPVNQALDSINFANYIMNENLNSGLREWQHSWRYQAKLGLIGEAIRHNDMKLIQIYLTDRLWGAEGVQLYNLTADASETNNIARENMDLVQLMQQKFTGPSLTFSPTVSPSRTPTISPIPTTSHAPTASCSDSPLEFQAKINNNKKIQINCVNVASNPDYYCSESAIAATCPSTCNVCNICEDSPLKFGIMNGNKLKFNDCKKVKKKPEKMCVLAGVDLTCQQTCGACGTSIQTPPISPPVTPPAASPTKFPSKSPTDSPTKSPVTPLTSSPTKSPTNSQTKSPVTPLTTSPTKFPSKSPTSSPTKSQAPPSNASCSDSPLEFQAKINNNKKIQINCVNVASNPDYYCSESAIAATCPSTCNVCNICEDSPLKFGIMNGNKLKFNDCKKVKKKPEKMCVLAGVDLTCQQTCGTCV